MTTSDPTRPAGTRRTPLARAVAKHQATGTVSEVEAVTPSLVRVRIRSEAVAAWRYAPGQHIRLQINDPLSLAGILRPGETLRAYTIWDVSPLDRAFEVRAHLYEGDGIGLEWFRRARHGDPVTYWGPQGDLSLREADFHLFSGEETGACGFAPLLRELPREARVHGVVESASPVDDPPLPGTHGLQRVHRNGASAVASATLLRAVEELRLPGPEGGVAYLVGEARTCQAIRTHLIRDRGWDRSAITTKAFWTPGKRGLHH